MNMRRFYLGLFLLIAFGLSAPVQLGYLDAWVAQVFQHPLLENSAYLLAGLGTALAGSLCLFLDKSLKHRISIFGKEKGKNSIVLTLPLVAFTLTGLDNQLGWNPHYFGCIYACLHTAYAFFEEWGWRRYLQNALDEVNTPFRFLLIGAIWWIWHFRFANSFDLFVFPLICIGGGYLLGKLADESGSLLPVVSMHTLIILVSNSGALNSRKLMGLTLVAGLWILLEKVEKINK